MGFPNKPPALNLNQLEERLVSPVNIFLQMRELPRGGQYLIKGNVVNVPSDNISTVRSLPRRTDDTNTIPLKLKRRLRYRSHYMYENIRPTKCVDAVNYLLTKDLFKKYVTDGFNDNWLQNSNINTEEHQNGEQVIEIPDQPIKKRTFPIIIIKKMKCGVKMMK